MRFFLVVAKSLSNATMPIVANNNINKRLSLWKGDLTTLDVDVVVNAANKSLLGGGGGTVYLWV